jgi:hypothetical protein
MVLPKSGQVQTQDFLHLPGKTHMSISVLSIDLIAKMASFEQDMGKAARVAEINAGKISAAFGGIRAGMAGLAAGVGVGGLTALAKATIDSMDALNDLSDATGASIENISALEDVAARTGTNFETVQTALIKFNAALNAAKPDSPQALAIEAIGLSVEKLRGLDPAEALHQTAVALSGFADDGNKARIVQELFGKSVKEVAALLKDLAESGKLVGTVTTEQAKQAEKFNNQLSDMQKNILDVSRLFASVLLPSISRTTEELKIGIDTFGSFTSAIVLLGTTSTSNSLTENIQKYREQIAEFEGDRKRYVNAGSDTRGIDDALNVAKKRLQYFSDLRTLQNQKYISPSDQFENESRRLGMSQFKPNLPGSTDGGKGGNKTAATKQSEADRYLETLTKQLEKVQDLTAVQQLGFDIVAGRVGKVTAAEQNNLVQLAQKIDTIHTESQAEKDLTEVLKQKRQASIEAGNAVAKSNEEYQALLARLLAATPTANLESQRNDVQLLTAEFEAGRISEILYLEAVTTRLDLVGEKVQNTKSLADELGLTFTSAFEDAIVGGKGFSEVLQGIEKDILRIMIRKSVTEPVGAFLSAGISSILGFDGGGYTGNAARAGGMDGKGGFMAMLHPQETVLDHTKGQSVVGQPIINNNYFTVGDVASISMVRQAVATSQRQIVSAFARSQNYGGAVA